MSILASKYPSRRSSERSNNREDEMTLLERGLGGEKRKKNEKRRVEDMKKKRNRVKRKGKREV